MASVILELYEYTCHRENFDTINSVRHDVDHIQILHRQGHSTCSYYDIKNIYIYDSMLPFRDNRLHDEQKRFLMKLYPDMIIY